ncbi:MAG: hypothetical protein FWD17_06700 [Polyangiaceae bacterium]|nr:hypothetical protein [Polyangiaceae bacterium]
MHVGRCAAVGIVAALALASSAGCHRSPSPAPSAAEPASPTSQHAAAAADDPRPPPADASVAPAWAPPPACGDAGSLLVFVSPEHPMRGRPLRVVVVGNHLVDAQLSLSPPGGAKTAPPITASREDGPPYFWVATVDAAAAGKWQATLTRDAACGSDVITSKSVAVAPQPVKPPGTPRHALWFTRNMWSPAFENLYSAWIQHMFDAPLDEQPSWNALDEVLRDRTRNFLHDFNGQAEDEQNVSFRPDCADLPYFLRAYFSYKLGLPFGFSLCRGRPPVCAAFATQSDPFPSTDDIDAGTATGPKAKALQEVATAAAAIVPSAMPVWADPDRPDSGPWETNIKRLGEFLRTTLAEETTTREGRTPADDETGDYYPVKLRVESLRPGTIFADPYGHVLVVARRVPQTPTRGGILFAVDGQPDGTVARKRFWRGNFLFVVDPSIGAAGFKRFRPIVRDYQNNVWRKATNKEISDYSPTEQYAGGVEGFYDKMDDLLSPEPLDPTQALLETIDALEEQVKTRAHSVDNGRKFLASGKGAAEMPPAGRIFEAEGAWEDFSTPARDLRLLIAIDVAHAMPARVARRPERYRMPAGVTTDAVRAQLEARLAKELKERTFEYTRTDGSPWKLSLQDVVDRQAALEMAYNPNDCVEARWGAPDGSPEASTCQAHAPPEQTAKMAEYRAWFHTRKRPYGH